MNSGAKRDTAKGSKSQGRSLARLGAVQALYQMDLAATAMSDILGEFEAHRLGRNEEGDVLGGADLAFFRDIVSGVVREQRMLDPDIDHHLAQGWRLTRIDSTLRAILRAGAYELNFRKDVPARVILDEYVELAKDFFDGDETRVVNGILDALARGARAKELSG